MTAMITSSPVLALRCISPSPHQQIDENTASYDPDR